MRSTSAGRQLNCIPRLSFDIEWRYPASHVSVGSFESITSQDELTMRVAIVGAGICGLGTALLLARDGHEVTLIDRDGGQVPDSLDAVWEQWERKGIAQFRQPHNLMPGMRGLLEAELPHVQDELVRAGASRLDFLNPLPPFADRTPRDIDDALWTWTARRPVAEWVFARAVDREPRITTRRGVRMMSLLTGRRAVPGVPHVSGVTLSDGAQLAVDLVVDCGGRQSACTQWLAAIDARPPYEEREDSGFTYYTRYFSGSMPERIAGTLTPFESFSVLTLPGDNNIWSVTLFVAAGDQPLKALRHEDAWMKLMCACPLHAHWLDGQPITPVLPMGGVVDRYRRLVVDDVPVTTGFVTVADAWACTNPSAGRGLTIGLRHAQGLRDVLRSADGNPARIVREFDDWTERTMTPWYHAQIAVDRARFAQLEAARAGTAAPAPSPLAVRIISLMRAMMGDADLFRAGLEYICTLTPVQQILERPAVVERIDAVQRAMKDAPPARLPGPDRRQMLEIVGYSAQSA
jgi:2-polyprenyl-6-methoxyphenol hydroxylase-like FAD-dependent oxidoreductase